MAGISNCIFIKWSVQLPAHARTSSMLEWKIASNRRPCSLLLNDILVSVNHCLLMKTGAPNILFSVAMESIVYKSRFIRDVLSHATLQVLFYVFF